MRNELSKEDILSALKSVPPDKLTYEEWIQVGMALKDGGFDVDVWDEWSKADSRYHEGTCYRKWNSFQNDGTSVGTIVYLAQSFGWGRWRDFTTDWLMDWNDIIQDDGFDATDMTNWDGVQDLIKYLELLFEPQDYVSYVTSTYQNEDGKFVPNKGVYSRTCESLLNSLKTNNKDITDTIGSYEPNVGAWIRFNPVDGQGVSNSNVTEYRYALVESDTLSIQEQDAIYRKFQLPIRVLVHSGGKSLHAIVKVDAKDKEEYRKRVEYLYDFLQKQGIEIDRQNRNPSRLSRLPGVMRNGNRQYITDTDIGRSSWLDWVDFVEGEEDELPQFITMNDVFDNPPEPPEELIEGVLRKGHKLLISGSSKAGKSFLLMELSIAIAEGSKWLGMNVKKGKVLYINLEIDGASCINRFVNIYKGLELVPKHKEDLVIWNLRGKAISLDKLVPKIVRRIKDSHYDAVVVDPIYKVQGTGSDENSAGSVAEFCNQFDKLCAETGASAIYCHHHSKGSQGAKKMEDRASGSGVFARDPDAILDMIELDVPQEIKNAYANTEYASAWQLEMSLREFSNPKPIKFWFEYPVHRLGGDELKDVYAEGSDKATQKQNKESAALTLSNAYEALGGDGIRVPEIANYLGIKVDKVVKLMTKAGNFQVVDGYVVPR